MFEVAARETLRARLVEAARTDPQVAGAALLGSAARHEEDRWSDIDLALRLAPGADAAQVAHAWTALVGESEQVVDHLDLYASGASYRVLLLSSTLQVDLSFWPYDQPLAGGAPVEVLFGRLAVRPVDAPTHAAIDAAGDAAAEGHLVDDVRMAWLYALHVRAALRRGRVWQALWMLEGIRNLLVGLCCRRLGLPAAEGRGVDRLPPQLLDELTSTHPAQVDAAHVGRAFAAAVEALLDESERQGRPVSAELARVLEELADGAVSGSSSDEVGQG
ncbi:MAG: hypothetical protein ACRYG2_30975 [Janthinobacterium lividum]